MEVVAGRPWREGVNERYLEGLFVSRASKTLCTYYKNLLRLVSSKAVDAATCGIAADDSQLNQDGVLLHEQCGLAISKNIRRQRQSRK